MYIYSGASSNACFLFNSYAKLKSIISEAPPSQTMFLIQSLFKIDDSALSSIPPLPKYVSSASLITN